MIRFKEQTKFFQISEIIEGFVGKHLILLNPSSFNLKALNNSKDSNPKNRILSCGPDTAEILNGQGAIKLFYDGYQ